jgi:hypothetical protein
MSTPPNLNIPDFKRYAKCRVCNSDYATVIDEAIAEGFIEEDIIKMYGIFFTDPKLPLTKTAIRFHVAHLTDAVDFVVGANLENNKISLPKLLDPSTKGEEASEKDKLVFKKLVENRFNEVEIMQKLVESGLEDLDKVSEIPMASTEDYNEKDKLRRGVILATAKTVEIKQGLAMMKNEATRVEKARIVYKLFSMFAKSMNYIPIEFRQQIAGSIKGLIKGDDELYTLLKEGEKEEQKAIEEQRQIVAVDADGNIVE